MRAAVTETSEAESRDAQVDRRTFVRDAALAALLLGCRAGRPSSAALSRVADTTSVVDTLRREIPRSMASARIPGLSITLVEGDATTWAEGFGYTDASRTTPVTAHTPFFVGSITKSITALAVLVAVNRRLMSLDAPVVEYLPWFRVDPRSRGNARQITVRHLLSHHAGLSTWAPVGGPYDEEYHRRTFEEVVRSMSGAHLKFLPGERFEYSNQGIDLAGFGLQEVAGQPIERVLREYVLHPLGMDSSTLDPAEVVRAHAFATPYEGTRAVAVRNGVLHPLRAAGGMSSTAVDLARFVAFHLRGARADGTLLVDPSLLREMYTPQFSARGLPTGYGLGVYSASEWATPRMSHGGVGYGVSTHYRWLPQYSIGVVVLTNQSVGHHAPGIAGRAIELMLETRVGSSSRGRSLPSASTATKSAAPEVVVDASSLRRLAGSYLLYERLFVRFEVTHGRLVRVDESGQHALTTRSATEFTDGTRVYTFVLDPGGKPVGVRIVDPAYDPSSAENSVLFLAANMMAADPPGPGKPAWARFPGRYIGRFIGEPTEVRVTLRDGYLTIDGALRLREHADGGFLTADNEPVEFAGERLVVGNKLYMRAPTRRG